MDSTVLRGRVSALPAVPGNDHERLARRARRANALAAYGLLAPAAFFYLAFQLLPIVIAFALSFFDWNGISLARARFTGLANYRRMLGDHLLRESVVHNLLVALALVVVLCGGSFLLAAVIRAGIKGGAFFRVVFVAPLVISSVAVGMLAIFVFSPSQGLLDSALGAVHLSSWEQPWLGSSTWALPTVAVTYMLQTFGFSLLLFISGLGQVSPDVLEAAEIDGASQGAILWRVVLPIIKPVTSVVVLLAVVSAFRLFDTVFVMTAGGPYHASDTMVTYLYSVSFLGNQVGYGNAIGVLLFAVLVVIAVLLLRLTRNDEDR